MKKILSLLLVCLLLTSCQNKAKENENKVESNNQVENTETQNNVEQADDVYNVIMLSENVNYNGQNVKTLLDSGEVKLGDIVDGMGYNTYDDDHGYLYIIDGEESFYIMICNLDNNKNVYISTDYDEAEGACK